jgi:flavin-dependent dehydrogenase
VLTIPSDNQTWSVTVFISAGDQPLKRMRDADRWTSVVAACPLQAHWLKGEPITGILPMGGVIDRYRRFTVDGRPVVTGIALVADAWACTNPSLGRGISFGLLHAQHLRDVARAHLDDPLQFAEAFDAVTEAELTPWYRETVEEDRARLAQINALRSGVEQALSNEPDAALRAALLVAIPHDADVFRAFLASRACITRVGETLARPEMVERILAVAGEQEPRAFPAPSRDQLLQLLN